MVTLRGSKNIEMSGLIISRSIFPDPDFKNSFPDEHEIN